MPINLKDLWVVTWSKSQNCFNVDTADAMILRNWEVYYHHNPYSSDWIVLAIINNQLEAREAIERLKKNMDNPAFGSTDVE